MVVYSDELCHHGILGMKWGVRRYQNKDGTLTSAGKRRYATGTYKGDVAVAKEKYKNSKKSIDAEYLKAGKEWDEANKNRSLKDQSKNYTDADKRFDEAASKWADDRKQARADYKTAIAEAKQTRSENRIRNAEYKKNALIQARLNSPRGYWTTQYAKTALATGTASLATAAVGALVTKSLHDKGYEYAAQKVYGASRQAVSGLTTASKVAAGSAFLNASIGYGGTAGGINSAIKYNKKVRDIKQKYD